MMRLGRRASLLVAVSLLTRLRRPTPSARGCSGRSGSRLLGTLLHLRRSGRSSAQWILSQPALEWPDMRQKTAPVDGGMPSRRP